MEQENRNKIRRHAEFISASSTQVVLQDKQQRQAWKTLNQVQGDDLVCYNGKNAFTLIELLVVVLIIGILAAVALPQYKIAVAKARLRSLMPLVDALVTSQESYYLANGKYALRFDDIDINIPTPNSITAANGAWGEIAHYPHFDLQVISAGGRAYGMTQGISYGVVMDNYTSADFYTCKRLAYASVSSEFPNQIIRGLGGRKLLTANGQNYYCLSE